MNIPRYIKIKGHQIEVIPILERESQHNSKATASLDTATIMVKCEVPESQQAEALLHEVLEFICHMHDLKIGQEYNNHYILSALSETLFAFLRENESVDFRDHSSWERSKEKLAGYLEDFGLPGINGQPKIKGSMFYQDKG